jgi:hypothetical protein
MTLEDHTSHQKLVTAMMKPVTVPSRRLIMCRNHFSITFTYSFKAVHVLACREILGHTDLREKAGLEYNRIYKLTNSSIIIN